MNKMENMLHFIKKIKKTNSYKKMFSKSMLSLFFLLSGSFLFISCSLPNIITNTTEKKSRIEVLVDNEKESFLDKNEGTINSNRSYCRSDFNTRNRDISLTTNLDYVDSINVGNYELKGRCEVRKQVVSIKVNGYDISENPACNRGRWELELDLSAVATAGNEITFEISHNGNSICKTVKVGFLGPENYIPIPYREDYYESSFYVMKYEAKLVNKGSASAKAVSKPQEKPISRVSYDEALKLCQNNGPRYDLIQNDQWQNIALSIEETDINWALGRRSVLDSNSLNCGVTLELTKEASSNDRDDCADSTCDSEWDFKRRTHILSNGQTIWDMCGNVGEMMKDKYSLNENFEGYIFKMKGKLKNLFGPDRTYRLDTEDVKRSRRNKNLYWGLGEAKIESEHDLIVRGSNVNSGAGIFSVSITKDQAGRSSGRAAGQFGFRCVYIP